MLVPIEEHHRDWVIQLVHLVEIRHLGDIAEIDNGEVLDLLTHGIQSLVHPHALWIPVVPESNDHDPIFFGQNSLVNMPARMQVREEIRHGDSSEYG